MGVSHENDTAIPAFQIHSHFKMTEEPTLTVSDGFAVTVSVGEGTESVKENEMHAHQMWDSKYYNYYHYPAQ